MIRRRRAACPGRSLALVTIDQGERLASAAARPMIRRGLRSALVDDMPTVTIELHPTFALLCINEAGVLTVQVGWILLEVWYAER